MIPCHPEPNVISNKCEKSSEAQSQLFLDITKSNYKSYKQFS
jgi:hypothetical protein